jgi:hypothetical protein
MLARESDRAKTLPGGSVRSMDGGSRSGPDGRGRARGEAWWAAVLIAVVGIGAVAVATGRIGIAGRVSDGTATAGEIAGRAALGAAIGVVGSALVVLALWATNSRHRLVDAQSRLHPASRTAAPRPRRQAWRRAFWFAVPLVLLLGALGAAAGAATTPLHPRSPRVDGRDGEPTARYVDRDKDGQADVDQRGNPVVLVDGDGNGTFDLYLVPCPDGSPLPTYEEAVADRADPTLIPIDDGCDGTIDRFARFDPRLLTGRSIDVNQNPSQQAPPPNERTPDFSSLAAGLGVLALLLALVAALYFGLRAWLRYRDRRRPEPPAAGSPAEPAAAIDLDAAIESIEASLEASLEHPDPRTAIINAYALLLDGLAAAGLPRQSYEAPGEHLARCLAALDVRPEPMRDLVTVFALARFSTHPVGEAHRATAVAALRAALADLAALTNPIGAAAP